MDAHEQEQIESIKTWWQENRWYILGGLLISAVIVGGWRYWLEHERQQAEVASLQYENVITQSRMADFAALETSVRELQEDFSGTPYASLATLKLAAAQVDAGNHDAAEESLRWVMDNTDDDELALVARLRLARVLLQQEDFAAVHATLDIADDGKFSALFDELRGDAFVGAGDLENARTAYESALAAMESAPGDRNLVQMKLDNLAMPFDTLLAVEPESEPAAEAGDDASDAE